MLVANWHPVSDLEVQTSDTWLSYIYYSYFSFRNLFMYLQSGKMWRKLMLAGSSGELNHHVFLSACLFDSLLAACLEVWEQQMVPLCRNESGRQGR